MLTVLTVLRSGGVYGVEYVERLRDGVAQHLKAPHRFVCLSDVDIPGVEPLRHGWPGWWAKAEMFSPIMEKYGRILYLDLSCVIVGDLSEIAARETTTITKDFYYGTPSQSVLMYEAKDFRSTWQAFVSDRERIMSLGNGFEPPDFGDQAIMNHCPVPEMDYWQDVLPGQLVSYKVHCAGGLPDDARIVKFHGSPKPHECTDSWLPHRVEFIPTMNTAIEVMLEQAAQNWQRDLPRAQESDAHDIEMVIVGGGPSLAENIGVLRFQQMRGAHIFALNGTHDYLIEHGIVPDFHLLLDARADNVCFVKRPHPRVRYLVAAPCHPDVFDALQGYDVAIWAPDLPGMHEATGATLLVGGGATVGLKALYFGYIMGHRSFHLYGMDSSYRETSHHAYSQPLNDAEQRMQITARGRTFTCAPWMGKQVMQFQEQARKLISLGCEVHVHGDGLLPHIAKLMNGETNASHAR